MLIDVASISSLGESTKTSLNETAKTSLGAESSLGDTTKTSLGETSLGAESCFGETISRKRFVPVKSEDDNTPLPSPFPLPKHYRSDVELALHTGKMIKDSMSAFLSSVASAMLVFKRYPTKEDYVNVARSIIEKYDFMSSLAWTPYVSCGTSSLL